MLNCGPVERRATTQSSADLKSFQENTFLATRNIIYWFSRISSGKMDKRKLSWVSQRRGRMTPTRVHVRWRKSKFREVFSSNFSILKHQIIDFFSSSLYTPQALLQPYNYMSHFTIIRLSGAIELFGAAGRAQAASLQFTLLMTHHRFHDIYTPQLTLESANIQSTSPR